MANAPSNVLYSTLGGAYFLAVVLAFAVYGLALRWHSRQRQLPPGPRPYPILGNIPHMTFDHPEKRFHQWKETYGDVTFLKLLSTPTLIVNSVAAARELLQKRSAKYSDRPHSVLVIELLGWEHDFGILPYNEETRRHRRWMHTHFFSAASLNIVAEIQRKEATMLLAGLLAGPNAVASHVHRYAAASMVKYLYGHDVTSADDEYLHFIDVVMEETLRSSAPGTSPVDVLPQLKYVPDWLPGAGFKRRAAEVKRLVREAAQKTFELAASNVQDVHNTHAVLPSLIKQSTDKGTLDAEKPEIMMFGLTLYLGKWQCVQQCL
ncbi:hypothetical protein FOMPIDRAFT_1123461 [Fomitopsis schrenkii]|uniref:Cytochrome P450 n=1 Tax=Fomitopsis schrenkii TaxID=2126942 RepID=S8E5Q1_FOMSC|nr:hypothetical protein FOMPIDRAFT_1123461 [Fomitopsis schrenkii]